MKNKQDKIRLLLGVVTLPLLLLSGCAGDKPTINNVSATSTGKEIKILSYDELEQEFFDSVAKLEWPDMYPAPTKFKENPDLSYQKGWGETLASYKFECAWSRQWLATYATDPAAASTAMAQLEKIPSMGFMSPERSDDNTRAVFAENLEKAKLGDPSGIHDSVIANCSD